MVASYGIRKSSKLVGRRVSHCISSVPKWVSSSLWGLAERADGGSATPRALREASGIPGIY